MRAWLLLFASLASATSVGDVVSDSIDATELTVYRDTQRGTDPMSLDDDYSSGIAMVTETRTIEIPAGTSTIQFRGVADGIVPQTAKLEGLPATFVEANFDYNLLTPGTLIAKSVGRPVTLIRTNESTGAIEQKHGILRTGPNGVLLDFNGTIEALNCSGLNERLVFADIPPNLTDTPTLSMTIRAEAAGKYQVQLSYLTLGMDWSADYTARIHPDGRRMDVSGWITLLNRNGSRFAEAKTNVVAGTLARDEEGTQAPEIDLPSHRDRCWPIGNFRRYAPSPALIPMMAEAPAYAAADLSEIIVTGSRVARASELGDYKLYTLPFATTVEPRQMKQARMLDREDVRFEHLYEYRVTEYNLDNSTPEYAHQLLRITNTKRAGLGLPLPAGTWRVIETTNDGRQYFVGEQSLEDTPVDLPRDLYLGQSNDVTVVSRLTEEESSRGKEFAIVEVEIGNAGISSAEVQILHARQDPGPFEIVKESHRHKIKDSDYVWTLRVPPNKRATLRYTIVPAAEPEEE